MSILRNKFDELISMSKIKKCCFLIGFIIFALLISQLQFTQLSLPVGLYYEGIIQNQLLLILIFCVSTMLGIATAKHFLTEFSTDHNKLIFRGIVVGNFWSVVFIAGFFFWLFGIFFVFLVTGKICIFGSTMCLN